MRKNYTFLLLLLAFALSAVAQNAHWEYGLLNTNTYTASSAVTVILSNGEAYIAHTEAGTDPIRLSEIDPTNMQATGTTYKFQNTSNKQTGLSREYTQWNQKLPWRNELWVIHRPLSGRGRWYVYHRSCC